MKMTVKQHEENLRNVRLSLKRSVAQADQLQQRILRTQADIAFAEKQLEQAQAQGRTEYDAERFLRQQRPEAQG